MFRTLFFALVTLCMVGCQQEIILSEDQIPEDVFVPEHEVTPFSGVCKIFYKNTSQLHYIFNYKNGILDGPFKLYNKQGKVQAEGNYSDGELDGTFVRYDMTGQLTDRYYFKAGKIAKNG